MEIVFNVSLIALSTILPARSLATGTTTRNKKPTNKTRIKNKQTTTKN